MEAATDGRPTARDGVDSEQRKCGEGGEVARAGGGLLRGCMLEKTREFFLGANKESATVLSQMLEREAWARVPILLEETGGIGGLLDANAQRFCNPHKVYRGIRAPYLEFMHRVLVLEQSDSLHPMFLLRQWPARGNPFQPLAFQPLGSVAAPAPDAAAAAAEGARPKEELLREGRGGSDKREAGGGREGEEGRGHDAVSREG
ncbi:unnamed protein product, partial [Discosporangium mesarthrocarpum]